MSERRLKNNNKIQMFKNNEGTGGFKMKKRLENQRKNKRTQIEPQ